MSHFSSALRSALDSLDWTQKRLGDLTGWGSSQISQYVCDEIGIGSKALEVLASVLPEPERARVVRAWLLDAIPPSADGLLTILTAGGVQELPELLPDTLDPELREAIRFLAHRAVERIEIRDLLIDLQRALEAE